MGKWAFLLAAMLLATSVINAEFALRSLSVYVSINRDGSAIVQERLLLVMNSTASRDLYEATRAAYSDIATWKERTLLPEMRHHISRATAELEGLRVTPQALERCNSVLGVCFATIVIDYSVPADTNGSGLVRVDRYKPRTARFSLQSSALSFEQTKSGDLVLPAGTNITFSIPQNAEKIYFSSPPQNIPGGEISSLGYYSGESRQFIWNGDLLPRFEFTYEIESPLEEEVIGFFSETQGRVTRFFFGPEGLAAFIIIAAGAASAYYFNRLNGQAAS